MHHPPVRLVATTLACATLALGTATLVCETDVRVARQQPGFTVHEGGKLVGRGAVQP
jgi:hypothetical protein